MNRKTLTNLARVAPSLRNRLLLSGLAKSLSRLKMTNIIANADAVLGERKKCGESSEIGALLAQGHAFRILRLAIARPWLERAYAQYSDSSAMASVLREDAALRFARIQLCTAFEVELAGAVVDLVEEVAELRNLARF